MQKISSYIYSNRIQVVTDSGFYPVEWKQVYQRNVKIYQGVDNVIEFDIKNAQQRRMDVSTLIMKMVIMDDDSQEICTVDVTPIPLTTGLASCTIPANYIDNIAPQSLKYSLYVVNTDNTKTPIYGDVQYGMPGKIDLIGGAMPTKLPNLVIDTFMGYIDDHDPLNIVRTFTSEAAFVNPPNDNVSGESFEVDFMTENLDADVTVQFSDSAVISAETTWYDIETFTIDSNTSLVTKTYNEIIDFSNNVVWMRVKYVLNPLNIGSFKKIIIKR